MQIFLDLLDTLIISATIFSKMGDGKNSGKLLFRTLYSGGGFTITEGVDSLTFSSAGGEENFQIRPYEIVFGTDPGITSSSNFRVCTAKNEEAFLGFAAVMASNYCDTSPKIDQISLQNNSFVIGGASNSLFETSRSVIVGGKKNSISNDIGGFWEGNQYDNVIVGGYKNCVYRGGFIQFEASCNSIIGSERTCISGINSFSISARGSKIIPIVCQSGVIAVTNSTVSSNQGNSDNHNLILSTNNSRLQNQVSDSDTGIPGTTCFNQIMSSIGTTINLVPTYQTNFPGDPFEIGVFSNPIARFNTALSSKGSQISNTNAYLGNISFNNLFSSTGSQVQSCFGNLISSDNSLLRDGITYYQISTPMPFSNIIGGCGNCLISAYSNIISSACSRDFSGKSYLNRPPHFNTIIGGFSHSINNFSILTENRISQSGINNSIIGGENNAINGNYSSILGGRGNKIGRGVTFSCNGLIISGSTNSIVDYYSYFLRGNSELGIYRTGNSGIITSGTLNCVRTVGDSAILVGGYKNVAFVNSTILSGSNNVTGFHRCREKYGIYDRPQIYTPFILQSCGSYMGVNCIFSSEIIISGNCNRTAMSYRSSIVGGLRNCITNSKDSVILGGRCNQIQAHGVFGTVSENWFVKGINYSGNFPPLLTIPYTARPPGKGTFYYDLGWSKNNFIIGGFKNSFGSCPENNYQNSIILPNPQQWGLTTSKTHYVYNSGIVGGCCNIIYNKSKILTEAWDLTNKNNRIVNSVIIGGKDIKLTKSNTFATGHLIITGSASPPSSGSPKFNVFGGQNGALFQDSVAGTSGTWTNVTKICTVSGIVVGVVGTLVPSDSRLKRIIQKIGTSPLGVNIYLFKYLSDSIRIFEGVIAQELLNTEFSVAVSIDKSGFYSVDYSKIDVDFREIYAPRNDIQ
jgi:hypothetical protein